MKIWNIDPAHSDIAFKVRHLMLSTVRGRFTKFDAKIEASDDSFADAQITFTAEVASISTENQMRDDHLRSADFFDAVQHPNISFVSTKVERDSEELTVSGDLTIRETTKPVVLKATLVGIVTGTDGKKVAGFEISGGIDRKNYGLTWNVALEAGGVLVGEQVTFEITAEFKEE